MADLTNAAPLAQNSGSFSEDLSEHLSDCACPACRDAERFKDDLERNETPLDSGPEAATSVATLQEMADFLETGYWNNNTGLRHNLGSTGLDPNNGVLYYNVTGYGPLTYGGGSDLDGVSAARADLIRDVFDVYEAVLGIDFVETTSTDDSVVDFFFSDNSSGAYAGSTRYGDGTIYYSYVNVAASWSGGSSTYDDYTLQTIFHEIGHALGLGHQGPYNGSGGYATDAIYELDSWQATMMSYFSQSENTVINASYEFLQTPMAVDWLALDSIYGQFGYGVDNAFTGDTTYGFNTTITANESAIWNDYASYADRTASTIVDGGGIDTVDFSGYSADQKIDLTVQSAAQTYQNSSDIGGRIGNLTLAVGTEIENAIGGSGDDQLIGNEADNVLQGGAGDDTFNGKLGDDSFHGDGGFDTAIFNLNFAAYSFSVLQSAIEVIGEGVDLVYDTVEQFQFLDIAYSFTQITALFGNTAPVAANDMASVEEGAALTLTVLSNDSADDGDALSIITIEGEAISAGGTVTLASGAIVTLNADGSLGYDQNGSFDDLDAGESGNDSFTYQLSDGNGGTDTATVAITITGVDDAPAPIGQAGVVSVSQSSSSQWHSVSFDAAIANAAVVMGPITQNDGAPATTRLRNVTDTGFEFQIDEWNYLDGVHGQESIGWLAMSDGTHQLASGQSVVAGTQSVGRSFTQVSYGETLGEALVFAQVASINDADAVTSRLRNVDATGFDLRIQEEQALGPHVAETVSWIAMETGLGSALEVVLTGDVLGDSTSAFDFTTSFASAPVLLADMQSNDGPDAATVRMSALDSDGVSLFVEEEQSGDLEQDHTNEIAGYAAMAQGLIYASSNGVPVATDDGASVAEDAPLTLDVLANDTDPDGDALDITAIAGQAVSLGGSVALASGAIVTLNADGTLDYDQNGAFDGLDTGDTGNDSFTYRLTDIYGASDQASVAITIAGIDDAPMPIGQSGMVTVSQTGPNQWHSVSFDAVISDAVVVMGPLSFNDGDAAVTRVRNITDTGFEFQIDEWNYLDGAHGQETIGWLALSEGSHSLGNGQTVIAGSASIGTGFSNIAFGESLGEAVVLAQASSVNEADAITTRIRNVDATGFQLQIEEEEALGPHVAETVSWIAMETGAAAGLDVVRTADQLDERVDDFTFANAFASAPVVLADMQSADGGDPAALRLSALDGSGLSLFVQEEQSANTETGHVDEIAGYVALDAGLIYEDSFLI